MKKILMSLIGVFILAAFAFQVPSYKSVETNLLGNDAQPQITTDNIVLYNASELGEALELESEVE